MTDASPFSSRQSPKRTPARIDDLTILVRVPDQPAATRAFTTAEEAEAQAYAAELGGALDPLPLQERTSTVESTRHHNPRPSVRDCGNNGVSGTDTLSDARRERCRDDDTG